jgi:hypothetical protein
MLRLGVSNNFDTFKKKVSIACLEKYKNLGRLINDEAYYVPPQVDLADFDLANDTNDIEKTRLREAHKRRDKEIDDMRVDRTSMFAYLLSKLSKESMDEVQGHGSWTKIETSRDPLELWLVIKSTHQILTTSKVASVIKKTAREEYAACRQGAFEHIVDYKRKFDARLDALKVSGNSLPADEDIAMDFLYGLDNSRYAAFKAEIVNDLQKGTLTSQIANLNKMYILASRRVVVKTSDRTPGGATFATVDGQRKTGKNPKNATPEGKGKSAEERYKEKLAKMKCYNCGEKGHIAKGCPHLTKDEENEDEEEPPMAGLTMACCTTNTGKKEKAQDRLFEFYEICLDSGSQVNIVDPRLLNNLRTSTKTYRSMNGTSTTERVGYLDGFFDCHACVDCPANIISMADVEDHFPMTWLPGESIIVHLDERDVIFVRKDKMWVGDFSDWIVSDEERLAEMQTELCLLTVKEKEALYTKREVRKALEAGEFLKSMGYPTEREAMGLVRDGNIKNIPYTTDDIRRFFDIYGPQVAGVRGKTTKRKPKTMVESDKGAKLQITHQELTADVMHVGPYKSLVSVSKPLGLTLIDTLTSQTKTELGRGLQAHINTLRSKGFEPTTVYVDPQKGLTALQGSFPGVEIDASGAGDHLPMIDTKIRRIKEIMRSVIAGLPYQLHKDRIKDLALYAVNRTNLKSSEGLISNESPRVRFTGVRPDFKSEFGLSFGDYVEAYDPRSHEKSNNVNVPRTQPCIALYPSANRNGSWVFWNLSTKTYVRRTQWKKLPISETIIRIMNDIAGNAGITLADIPVEKSQEEYKEEQMQIDLHTPLNAEVVMSTDEYQACDEEIDLPELIQQYADDDDSGSESEDIEEEEMYAKGDGEDEENEAIQELFTAIDSDASSKVPEQPKVPLRRTQRESAGKQRYDDSYNWNLMNLSVGAAIRNFGDVAEQACKAELVQLFREKKALVPVLLENLTEEQKRQVFHSHMFLTEKFEDGKFVKMKGRVVADGRMQDRAIYSDFSSPTAKTRSVMTCLKLAAVKGWDLLKLDVGGAFLCAPIGDGEQVFMSLERDLASKAVTYMPELEQYLTENGKLIVRVDRAMYGLIQSAKLWYNELTRHLLAKGFKKSTADECILVKKMESGQYILVILYVDDILVLGKVKEDRHWVKRILEDEYKKITFDEGDRLTYLGMTILKRVDGYEISMKSYIEDILALYGKSIKTCVTPAKPGLFDTSTGTDYVDSVQFHSIVAKLLYLGKRGRPNILLPVQYLCTRVKKPTVDDQRKLERVLGYILLTKTWTRIFDNSPFDTVTTYIDASFAMHADGKSQSGCMVFLGNTLVHEGCRKQRLVTLNSTEAELVALSDYIEEGELVEGLLADLGILMMEDFVTETHVVYQDNQSTIKIVMNGGKEGKQRSKYMKVRAAYVYERLCTTELMIEYLHTSKMVADLLTKPLGGELFHRHAQTALGRLPAMCNRGAKRKTTGKRGQQGDLVGRFAKLTCTQPVSQSEKRE